MPIRYLRQGLPTSSTLTVSQHPCLAKLDQNESSADLPTELKAELLRELSTLEWNRYPQPSEYVETRRAFARALDLDPDTLVLTAGCDQAIQGAHFVAGGPGRKALTFDPTYPMLHHAGVMAGTEVVRVGLGPEYEIRPDHFDRDVQLILIASPNNPTGACLAPKLLEAALSREAFVFIDEAYFDLSKQTFLDRLASAPNLMLGRSCSKSLLAGMRLGYTLSHPEVALRLDHILTAPYHLSHAQLLLARRFEMIRPHVEAAADRVIDARGALERGLRTLGVSFYPSRANFLLLSLEEAAAIYETLALAGIRVRYAPKIPGLEGHLRITVGSPEENSMFLERLSSLL